MPRPPLKSFQKQIGYSFKHRHWLETALIHPSFRHEGDRIAQSDNQRLEFLGDAVVGLLTAEFLYMIEPDLDEGTMTKIRSMVTNRGGLAEVGNEWGLGGLLRLGKGEALSGGAERESNVADAVEAVIGAIFQDGGMKACRKFFKHNFEPRLRSLLTEKEMQVERDNPKGSLQELLQRQGKEAPVYQIVAETGPAHDRQYVAAVYWNQQELARGQGPGKRAAEAKAAANALQALSSGGERLQIHC
jgi:ribonuclease-3